MAGPISTDDPISTDNITAYLLERGLISGRDVVKEGVMIREIRARNYSYAVYVDDRPRFILKQARRDTRLTLEHEILVYSWLASSEVSISTSGWIPSVRLVDRERWVLVLEMIGGADLAEYYGLTKRLPLHTMGQLGRLLMNVHKGVPPLARETAPVAPVPPTALTLFAPPSSSLAEMSAGNVEVVRTIQQTDGLSRCLQLLYETWSQTTPSFCHNDLRWPNILRQSKPTKCPVVLIDWELGGLADAAWDVGSVIGSLIESWILSIPIFGDSTIDEWITFAKYPLVDATKAIGVFWTAYNGPHHGGGVSHDFQLRCVQYASVRLLQTAFEHCQTLDEPSPLCLLLLQVASNIMLAPEVAVGHFLGGGEM